MAINRLNNFLTILILAATTLISCDNSARLIDCLDGCSNKRGSDGLSIVGPQGVSGLPGVDGVNGADAPISDYTVTELIDPCGDSPGIIDEVLLRFSNGQLLASFSANAAGDNTRFAVIGAGNYLTTDGSSCLFTVHSNGDVTW